MQNAEHHRARFELAYATEWAKAREGNETPERLAAEVKTYREGDTYEAGFPRLRFGWEGYQWALAGRQCLAQIQEPAAVAGPADDESAAFQRWFQGEQGKPYQGMWEFARAAWIARAAAPALEAPAAPTAPNGWKLVPVEPTIAMLLAGDHARISTEHQTKPQAAYAAMLAAAPQAPAAPAVDAGTLRDADRYRWLRRNVGVYRTDDGRGPVSPYLLSRTPASDAIAEETDIAIDAAIAAQAKEGGAA